jgi:hypothetical protein
MKLSLHELFKALTRGNRPKQPNRCRLQLEVLEARLTPSSIAPQPVAYPPNPCVPAAITHAYPPNPC